MKRYTSSELEHFLLAIDRNLSEPAELIIIGGTAAALAYKYKGATQDIDAINSITSINYAIEAAKRATGFAIPVSRVGVFDPPYNFEERLMTYESSFKKLKIRIPEVVDLILMKVVRCEEHDLQAIEALVKSEVVTVETLIERFKNEMSQAIKRKQDLEFNLLVAIERAFGEEAAEAARPLLK